MKFYLNALVGVIIKVILQNARCNNKDISVRLSSVSFFHLLTHALFKVLLFMCAGGVIHSIGDSQDIRFMGIYLSIYIYLFIYTQYYYFRT